MERTEKPSNIDFWCSYLLLLRLRDGLSKDLHFKMTAIIRIITTTVAYLSVLCQITIDAASWIGTSCSLPARSTNSHCDRHGWYSSVKDFDHPHVGSCSFKKNERAIPPFFVTATTTRTSSYSRTKLEAKQDPATSSSSSSSALSISVSENNTTILDLREEFLESHGLLPLFDDDKDGDRDKQQQQQRQEGQTGSTTTNHHHHGIDASPGWETLVREWAADTLEPILFPATLTPQNMSASSTTTPSIEKALKRTLRALPSKEYLSQRECRWIRNRLAKLILGTSIMRRRYEYIWNVTTTKDVALNKNPDESLEQRNNVREKVIAMIKYYEEEESLSSFSAPMINSIQDDDVPWPLDITERLSVYYSLPLFLVKAWVEQYGPEQTEQICKVCNKPGPITFRRNALKCPSDKLLIDRILAEEDLQLESLQSVYQTDDAAVENTDCESDTAVRKRRRRSYSNIAVDGLNHDTEKESLRWIPPRGCLRLPSVPHKRSIWSMNAWKDGWFEVQDMGSQLIVQATEARWGETAVDYCAGNGGKTLALASQMYDNKDNSASPITSNNVHDDYHNHNTTIVAHDISDERIRQLRGSFQRAGLMPSSSKHKTEKNEAQKQDNSIRILTTSNAQEDLFRGEHNVMADVVLVDAPCSSSGVLRRRPSQRWDINRTEVQYTLPKLQLEILQNASKLVKPGGRLVYATCSILKWENENIVKAFEEQQQQQQSNALQDENDNKDAWDRWSFHDDDGDVSNSNGNWARQQAVDNKMLLPHCKYLLPHCHDTDGFFIARWKKRF